MLLSDGKIAVLNVSELAGEGYDGRVTPMGVFDDEKKLQKEISDQKKWCKKVGKTYGHEEIHDNQAIWRYFDQEGTGFTEINVMICEMNKTFG